MEFDEKFLMLMLNTFAVVVIFALFLERAVAALFEWTWWKRLREKVPGTGTPVVYLIALAICNHTKFDALLLIRNPDNEAFDAFSIGTLVTAGVIAGGSKGAILLFQDILGFGEKALETRRRIRAQGGGVMRPTLPR